MTGSSWFYSKDEATSFNADIVEANTFNFSSITLNYYEAQLQMK